VSESKLILPTDADGVANLEIKRMQSQLEDNPSPPEMNGHMEVEQSKTVVAFLKRVIREVEAGQVRSVVLIWSKPKNKKLPETEVLFGVDPEELSLVDGVFHKALDLAIRETSKKDDSD